MSRLVRTPVPGLPEARRRMLMVVSGGVWLSGLIWLLFHYGLRQKTDFGYTSHPMEHWSLAVHGMFAFAALWMFGLLWGVHIQMGWRRNRRRRSGGTLFGIVLWLAVSGLGLYYLENPDLLTWLAVAHWVVGISAAGAFALHWLARTQAA